MIDASFSDMIDSLLLHKHTAGSDFESPSPFDMGDILDIPTNTSLLDRSSLGVEYERTLANGSTGLAMGLKLQSDYLAVHERAALAAVATPLRCIVLARARKRGHGSQNGPVSNVRSYISSLAEAIA